MRSYPYTFLLNVPKAAQARQFLKMQNVLMTQFRPFVHRCFNYWLTRSMKSALKDSENYPEQGSLFRFIVNANGKQVKQLEFVVHFLNRFLRICKAVPSLPLSCRSHVSIPLRRRNRH